MLSCVVVGDATVTFRCAEILLAGGHSLLGVVTGGGRVAAWAAARGVPCRFAPPERPLSRAAVEELAGGRPFDVLLSIHNLRILPPEVLALPAGMAVNYHDALLPRYAGLHATSWAILQGEAEHGITWHRMDERVDAGEILLQRRLEIAADDTAWSLNVRCAEAAVESFPELLAGLAAGRVAPCPQAGKRSWFPGWRRPAPGCAIPWDASAATVSAFVRALDFGAADNPLGIPKLLAPAGALRVKGAEALERRSGEPPGTVLAVGPEGIEIATATGDVRVWLAEGEDASGLAPGLRLPAAAPAAERLAAWERSHKKHEGYWEEILAGLAPLAPPTLDGSAGAPLGSALPADADEALAALLAWLALEIGEPFHVALGEPELRREIAAAGWEGLLASRPPFRVEIAGAATLRGFSLALTARRRERAARGTYPADLPARLRRLRSRPAGPAVVVDLLAEGEDPADLPPAPTAALAVTLSRQGELTWSGPLRGIACRFLDWWGKADPDRPLRPAPGPETLAGFFREQVERAPAALALEVGEERWSYGDLARRAERLADALRRRGVGHERLVALRLERLPDLVAAILGVLEAGGAFLVLDPSDPPRRQARILEEARPWLAVGDPGLQRMAPDLPVHPIALADAPEGPAGEEGGDGAGGSGLAYVAFTSGSTGSPKGVAVEHRSAVSYVRAAGRRFGLGPGDRLLQIGSPAFDLAYEQIFGALGHGATLVGLPERGLPPSRDLLDACEGLRITVLDLPTIAWERLARDAAEQTLALPTALRLTVIGGDAARTATARLWLQATGGRSRLLNTYGPTEGTIVAAWWEAPAATSGLPTGEALPLGRPVDGVTLRVLDEERRPVPAGEAGELWLGGAGLARGYHRRPDLTAERFRTVDGERLYRTGDRVRLAPDGELEFLGRLDRQVKIAGRRVEPGEVEAVLREIPGVAGAVAAPLAGEEGALRLGAWVVLRGTEPDAVRREAARRLPAPLRPARLMAVEDLPRAPSGKVDLAALPELPATPAGGPRPPFRDPWDEALAALWESVLGAGAVSPEDDFFDQGGDSLSAVALLAGIEKAFGRRIPVARLLRASTFAGLSREIRRPAAEGPALVVPLQPLGSAPPLICMHGLGGHLLRLLPLARALAPDLPVYGLQSPGIDGEGALPETVEAAAALFLAELRRRWGSGPYRLCGQSFGGAVAFEMARQAAAAGVAVPFVALFDTDLREILPATRPAPAAPRGFLGRLRRRLGGRPSPARQEIPKPEGYPRFDRIVRANEAALARYRPGAYQGTVTFFAATEWPSAVFRAFIQRTGCRLEAAPMPGGHLGMLEPPHVETLAAELRRRLAGS